MQDQVQIEHLRILVVAQQLREFVSQRYELFQELLASGHELKLIADPHGATVIPDLIRERLVVWSVRNHSLNVSDLVRQVLTIRNLVLSFRPDVCHTVHYRSAILGGLGTRTVDVPVLAEFGGVGAATTHGWGASLFVEGLARLALGGRRRVIGLVQADAHRAALEHTGITEWRKVPGCGIAVPAGLVQDRAHRVMFVGRFTEAKGIKAFIQTAAAARGCRRHPFADADWVAVGSIDERDPGSIDMAILRRMAAEARVHLPGQLPPMDTLELIGGSEVLLLPSVHPEGIPRVVIEALALGTPVLTSMAGGMGTVEEELGIPNRLPWLRLNNTEPEKWGRALVDAFGQLPNAVESRVEAQRWARRHFSLEIHAATVSGAYHSLAKAGSRIRMMHT